MLSREDARHARRQTPENLTRGIDHEPVAANLGARNVGIRSHLKTPQKLVLKVARAGRGQDRPPPGGRVRIRKGVGRVKKPVSAGRASGQTEGPHQEGGHLAPGGGRARAVVPAPAAGRDALVVELLDPIGVLARAGHVAEDPGTDGRRVRRTVLRLQQEDRHLGPGHRCGRAVVPAPAPGRDSLVREPLDPVGVLARAGHVPEEYPRRPAACSSTRAPPSAGRPPFAPG